MALLAIYTPTILTFYNICYLLLLVVYLAFCWNLGHMLNYPSHYTPIINISFLA